MNRFFFYLLTGLFIPNLLIGQNSLMNLSILDEFGERLHLAQFGGVNQAQISQVDLNNDGVLDLFIFDRTGGHMSALSIDGSDSFNLHNEWLSHFPRSTNFMLLRDYNCDNVADIFTYHTDPISGLTGVKVYRGWIGTDQLLHFSSATERLLFLPKNGTTKTQISISSIDLPAIDDIDNDGDLDILNFASSGGHINYFENRSIELGHGCDSLIYHLQDNCWGRMYESGLSPIIDLSPRQDSCPSYPNWLPRGKSRHAGSTLTTLDMNNDNIKDILIGDLSFANINLLTNGGSPDSAWLITQEANFPDQDIPIQLDIFPATFHVDIDLDGARDLLISPNIEGNAQNRELWLYRNVTSDSLPSFIFTNKTTWIDQMIDLGSGSFPSSVDLNGDGMTDLIIGNDQVFNSPQQQTSSLMFLQNKGLQNGTRIQIQSEDLANLSTYGLKRVAPAWGDLDADGDQDLVIGIEDGTLLYFINNGSSTTTSLTLFNANLANIDVGQNAVPCLYDVDSDGDLDLIVGERNGNTNLFLNQGDSSSLSFTSTADSETFGFIDVREPGSTEGNAAPFLFNSNGQTFLAMGSESGTVRLFSNIDNNIFGFFDEDTLLFKDIHVGTESSINVSDIDQDGFLDLIVGNKRGGINIFQSVLTKTTSIPPPNEHTFIYPNPVGDIIWIDLPFQEDGICRFFNTTGQQIVEFSVNSKKSHNIKNWPAGTYFAIFESRTYRYRQKFIKL